MKKKQKVACFGLGVDQKNYVTNLSKKFRIIGFDENSKAPGIKYVEKCYHTPFNKKYQIKEILKKEKIERIFSFATEAPMLLIGYLNSELNLDGIKLNLIKKISNKLMFKRILQNKEINQPSFFAYQEIRRIKTLKKIFIAKPIIGSGSENIFILKNTKILNSSHDKFFFEEYIDSDQIYAIDGFCIKKNFFLFHYQEKKSLVKINL